MLFAGTFFISLFVLMMQFLWRYVDTLIGKGLSIDVLAQFFWYMALMLVSQALPLAVLLSSLITFGNLGESSELTAIKASGISLIQSFRSLIVISIFVSIGSFYFQNNIGPHAYMKLAQLMVSMKQKSPELEIPQGQFYDGIPQCNIYVQKKNVETGKLYGIMIYRMTESYEDAAIILADSGMLQSTAEKKHLVLNLWSGEWFENMRDQQLANSASVPYRRESFIHKKMILDFDGDFNLTDASGVSGSAKTKSLARISQDIDSLKLSYDSIGHQFYNDARLVYFGFPNLSKHQMAQARAKSGNKSFNLDSVYKKLSPDEKRTVVNTSMAEVQNDVSDLEFKSMLTTVGDRDIRQHKLEAINKFSLALSCLIFFFIGAPLGAIIRKGGLGVPIIVSVVVFIIYYILDNTGYKMARQGSWAIWFGKGLSPAVLIPMAVFFTYKANNDSTVFNIDSYRNALMRMLGLRMHRNIASKEVIISNPDYISDRQTLQDITSRILHYNKVHNLKRAPNFVKVFFRYQPDHEIEEISSELEAVIEDLGNTRDRFTLSAINRYPILVTKAHTRPFERRWLNILSAVIVPMGLFFYIRMWGFRLRLYRDLVVIHETNDALVKNIDKLEKEGKI